MSTDLSDYIQFEVARALARFPTMKAAEITAYDPQNHRIKAMLHPDGIETGWFSVNTAHTGNGWGIAIGPKIGDQISVGFFDGNIETPHHLGRLHSDKERPPVVQSGEMLFQHESGTKIKIDSGGHVTIDAGGANVNIASATLTHNGHDVGSTHKHTNVTAGSDLTGVPQ